MQGLILQGLATEDERKTGLGVGKPPLIVVWQSVQAEPNACRAHELARWA